MPRLRTKRADRGRPWSVDEVRDALEEQIDTVDDALIEDRATAIEAARAREEYDIEYEKRLLLAREQGIKSADERKAWANEGLEDLRRAAVVAEALASTQARAIRGMLAQGDYLRSLVSLAKEQDSVR